MDTPKKEVLTKYENDKITVWEIKRINAGVLVWDITKEESLIA